MSAFAEIGMITKYRRPAARRMLHLEVRAVVPISPHFMSITLGGDDVRHLDPSGFDQNGRLFFALPGQEQVDFPPSSSWMLAYGRTPASRRPRTRFYSIRRSRPEALEFDLEVVLHDPEDGHLAPGNAWARGAVPGDRVAFLDEGRVYGPTPGAEWQLLVGDESALPPILAILEQSDPALPAEAFLEVPTLDDIRSDVVAPPNTVIHWLPRDGSDAKPGVLALETVRNAKLPSGRFYTWTAGERELPTGLRRHLVADRGVPRSDVAFLGYWRHGRADLG